MGALVAFELARQLQQRYLLSPVRLIAAAAHPPGVRPARADLADLAGLGDEAFVALLQRRYGGIPQEILEQPDHLRAYLPVLRADLTILDAYRPAARPLLRCPVTALVGADDHSLSLEQAGGWRAGTAAAFDSHTFPGGHFGLLTQRDLVLDRLRAEVGSASPAPVP
jgi:medium-chain acyl-[acyl-carrier-protein] hydrolase